MNTNTNYNAVVDAQAGRSGAVEVARFLAQLLQEEARGRSVLAHR